MPGSGWTPANTFLKKFFTKEGIVHLCCAPQSDAADKIFLAGHTVSTPFRDVCEMQVKPLKDSANYGFEQIA